MLKISAKIILQFFIVFATFLFATQVYSVAPSCKALHSSGSVASIGRTEKDFLRFRDHHAREILSRFSVNKDLVWARISKLPKDQAQSVEHLLNASEFFDWQHTAEVLLKNFIKNRSGIPDFSGVYDQPGERAGQAFRNYVRARDYLRNYHPEVEATLLIKLHRILMNGLDDVPKSSLGSFRQEDFFGDVSRDWPLRVSQVNEIMTNPYLKFESRREYTDREPSLRLKLWSQGGRTQPARSDRFATGEIIYPHFFHASEALLNSIQRTHPDVYRAIKKFLKENPQDSDPDLLQRVPKTLQANFIGALVENRFKKFETEVRSLGKIEIGKNEVEYINLVADFYRDLVAIHPLHDGNGRTLRLFMNYLLTREGLPPARVVDPTQDVQVSKEKWREMVRLGVVNNGKLYQELVFRLDAGLPVEFIPELLFPGLPDAVVVRHRQQGQRENLETEAYALVDGNQFSAFIKTIVGVDPTIKEQVQNDVLRTVSRLAELFVENYRFKTIRYIHQKDGEREISLRFVDPAFVEMFQTRTSSNPALYHAKIERWYDKSQLVWRGLADLNRVQTDSDILALFKKPSLHLASNSVVSQNPRSNQMLQAIKRDFEAFNKSLLDGSIISIAVDHHTTGPLYAESFGLSTSKREVVGKGFAMGAMVVGDYGMHRDPKLQAKIKSRINVASYRGLKDIDLGRLRQFDERFNYQYARQSEVMAIGAVDPDAVVLAQRLDSQGEVVETFYRDPIRPQIILKIKGRYVPGEKPFDPGSVLTRYDLYSL